MVTLALLITRADWLRAEQQTTPLTRVELRLAERSVPETLPLADVYTALNAAARAWSYPAISCSSVVVTVGEPSRARLVGQDGTNLVIFRQERWCLNERCGGNRTFPLRAAAMTSVYPNGATIEGDVELNAVSLKWDGTPDARHYLSVVLAHELGHVLGFPDVCALAHGKPVLEGCADRDSIMFAPARLPKPSPRDVMQLCRRFPRATRWPASQSTGASTLAFVVAGTLATLLLALQLLVTRRNRRE